MTETVEEEEFFYTYGRISQPDCWQLHYLKDFEGFFVELNLRKKKILMYCSYNPAKSNISSHLSIVGRSLDSSMKFYIWRNNSKVDSIETGRIEIAHLLPWSDLEKCIYTTLFQLMTIEFYHHYLIYEYNFTFSLFCSTCKVTNDKKNFKGNFYF